jgi:hypothetical protein
MISKWTRGSIPACRSAACFYDKPMEYELDGKTIKVPAGRVHGYQVEIDPDVPAQAHVVGGIYDEGRRGWLYPVANNAAQKAFSERAGKVFKPDDWNQRARRGPWRFDQNLAQRRTDGRPERLG